MSFKLNKHFKFIATALTTTLGLSVPSLAQEFETLSDMAKHTWQTLPDAGTLESPIRAAMQLIQTTAPDMAAAFETSVLMIRPTKANSAYAQFLTVGDNDDIPVIVLYDNQQKSLFEHAYVQHINQGNPNTPDYDEYMTAQIALNLTNEIAHLRQFQTSPEQFAHITSTQNETFCPDTMALEKASDTLTINIALGLFEHFKTLPADKAERMTIALNDALYFSGFNDFTTYAHNPSNSDSLALFEQSRNTQYASRKQCPPNDTTPISNAAKTAVQQTFKSP